ncbi:Uncharacterised protein [BD1-7 clade bacterium]|uniref:Glutamine cyclotransferase n=1 Tax=BD1-7 clade bacterium TaxID=2029982 RepID=A0A5S9QAD9_9GAMM|nr:Uncharacterised protein [BD1-7 clade bacterium]
MHTIRLFLLSASLLLGLMLTCVGVSAETSKLAHAATDLIKLPPPIRSVSHDPRAFTQGLVIEGRSMWQSSGLYGRSYVERLDAVSGKVVQRHYLSKQFFAEGVAVLNDTLYLLSWRAGRVWMFHASTLVERKQLRYHGEGWGLASDGRQLLMSDGSAVIRYRDPVTFHETHSITVTENGQPVSQLNELEWVEGKLWANIWKTDDIVIINPETGVVETRIDASALRLLVPKKAGVLNGIAYDPGCHCIWLTGKNWPAMFLYQYQYGRLTGGKSDLL